MERREFLQTLAGGSLILLVPARLSAEILKPGNSVAFRCLGNRNGARWLDGRTQEGAVGLAPVLGRHYTGTKWAVVKAGEDTRIVHLKCLGLLNGNRFLDGRTQNGTVGLAPHTSGPFTGARWQVVEADENNPSFVFLKCMGREEGSRWLAGRTDGTVGLASRTELVGTKWEVQQYPVIRD